MCIRDRFKARDEQNECGIGDRVEIMECRPLDLVAELTDAVLFCEARIRQEGLLLHYTCLLYTS